MISPIVIAESFDWLDILKQERHVAQQTNTGYMQMHVFGQSKTKKY